VKHPGGADIGALNRQDLSDTALDCTVLVHAVNPPGYRRWSALVLPMLDNTIAAAIVQNAAIVLPGTIYNYGPETFPVLTEESPQHPVTRKGAIRVELKRRLFEASRRSARVLIVRAGDFFGPKVGNTWFSQRLVKPGQPVKTVSYPGDRGVGHQWSYVPDVACTMVELLGRRDTLNAFASFHMAGHWDADGTQMTTAIQRVVGRLTGSKPRVNAFPWWLVTVASPFVATFRELHEMRYLWRTSVRMDNVQLTAVLGREPHTPLDEAIEATLVGMGCLARKEFPPGSRSFVS
jgi:nucleoside-diphosphate-sugar epimerase